MHLFRIIKQYLINENIFTTSTPLKNIVSMSSIHSLFCWNHSTKKRDIARSSLMKVRPVAKKARSDNEFAPSLSACRKMTRFRSITFSGLDECCVSSFLSILNVSSKHYLCVRYVKCTGNFFRIWARPQNFNCGSVSIGTYSSQYCWFMFTFSADFVDFVYFDLPSNELFYSSSQHCKPTKTENFFSSRNENILKMKSRYVSES